jgi:hypothetical protein
MAGMESSVPPAFAEDEGNVAYRARKNDSFHMGGNVFLKVTKDNPCIDVRQYWTPPNQTEVIPTKKGLCLRPTKYKTLRDCVPDIENNLPELKNVIPCYMRDDHKHPLEMLKSNYCNPHDYFNW